MVGSKLFLIGALVLSTQISRAGCLIDLRDEINNYIYLQHAIVDTFNISNKILEAAVCSDALEAGKLNTNARYIICMFPASGKYNINIYSLDVDRNLTDYRSDSVAYQSIPPSVEGWIKRIDQLPKKRVPTTISEQLINSISMFRLYSIIPSPEGELKAHSVDGPEVFMTIFEHQRIFNLELSFNVRGDRKIINDLIAMSRNIAALPIRGSDLK